MSAVAGVSEGVPGVAFREGHVEADGFRIRYWEAGTGEPLVCLHGAGSLRLSRAHDILARDHRVIAFEIPGFGESAANERSATMVDLGTSMRAAVAELGITRYSLMGNSFGAKLALWMAVQQPQVLQALVLIAPAAIRESAKRDGSNSPEDRASLLYAHPERHPPLQAADPAMESRQQALVGRLLGPPRDPELEE